MSMVSEDTFVAAAATTTTTVPMSYTTTKSHPLYWLSIGTALSLAASESAASSSPSIDAKDKDEDEDRRYQWQRDGVDVPGANRSVLVISSFEHGDEGLYRCLGWSGDGTTMTMTRQVLVETELQAT
eukprot:gene4942-6552_t